ncbi:MAG: SurA N-terminal domain-containing protein [Aquabacterium sp.]|uniref:peptidylprolyl isomerase n=1 Tax=Aquabacterium sp. TaxID=1872578 RepID=UPI0025BC54E5|nr:SurA N-terminal domain-containing protein [Aquabacterium sp.]MBI5924243.1 SurA N-terminal domain-containing protein [Aquabacterium sp.]
MFDFVRKHTRILQILLILLILPSFVVFGIQGYSSFSSDEGVVAKVGSQKIMQTEWDNANRNVAENYRAQQPGIDAKLFDTPEFKSKSLDSLVRQSVLSVAAFDQNLSAPVSRLVRAFATDPRFASLRNPDGSLNKQLLEAQGMTPARLEALLRQELTMAQVLGGVQSTGQTSTVATKAALEAMFQVRDVQWMKFEPKAYAAALNPGVDQLQAFYKDPANSGWLTEPEKADVQFLVLDLEALKTRVSVNEDDLRRSYKENEKRFTVPEERRARHILVEVKKDASVEQKKAARAKAEQLLAQLQKNPSQFAELAKKNSDDPGSAANGGDLDFFGRGAMTKAFEDAAFALKPGQISDVVESDYGFHIILLTEVRGGQTQPYEAVKAQLEDDARKQLAQREFASVAEKFTNGVYEQSDSLKPTADELKLQIQSASGVLRDPGSKDQGVLSNRRVLDALFDPANRSKSRNTEAIEVGPSKLVSARIVKYSPATRQPFEAVQTQLRERWVASESLRAARKDAEGKMALWKQSPEKSQLPASVQMSGKTIYNQPPVVLESALRIPEKQLPAWTVVDLGPEGVALLKVNKVLPMQISEQELGEAQSQYGGYWGKAEADAYYRALKRQYKVQFVNEGKKTMDKVTESQKTSAAE